MEFGVKCFESYETLINLYRLQAYKLLTISSINSEHKTLLSSALSLSLN